LKYSLGESENYVVLGETLINIIALSPAKINTLEQKVLLRIVYLLIQSIIRNTLLPSKEDIKIVCRKPISIFLTIDKRSFEC
jgi:uncharacterized membrane protein